MRIHFFTAPFLLAEIGAAGKGRLGNGRSYPFSHHDFLGSFFSASSAS